MRITSGRYDLMPKIDAQIAAGKQWTPISRSCRPRRTSPLEAPGRAAKLRAAGFRPDPGQAQGSGRAVPAGVPGDDRLGLQPGAGLGGRCAAHHSGFPQARLQGQDRIDLSARRRSHALQQHADRREIRLGDDRKAAQAGHAVRAQPRPGGAGNREGRAAGHVRSDLAVQQGSLRRARRSADAGLSDHHRHLRQGAASQRRQAFPGFRHLQGAAATHRRVRRVSGAAGCRRRRPASSRCRITASPTATSPSFPTRTAPRSCATSSKAISASRKGAYISTLAQPTPK